MLAVHIPVLRNRLTPGTVLSAFSLDSYRLCSALGGQQIPLKKGMFTTGGFMALGQSP